MERVRRSLWQGAVVAITATLTALPTVCLGADRSWQIGHGAVRVVCPLTVGGSFEARTTSLTGNVALASTEPLFLTGDFVVDLRTLDTGIELRNGHLREQYLEVGKGEGFDKAVLSDIHLAEIDFESFEGRTSFTGTLLLHGNKKPIGGQVEIRRSPSSVGVEASFPVTLADFGIAKPQFLGVGVKSQVQVKVTFAATPGSEPAAAPR